MSNISSLDKDSLLTLYEYLPTSNIFNLLSEDDVCNLILLYPNHPRVSELLKYSSKTNRLKVVNVILENNLVDPNIDNGYPLFIAASYGNFNIVSLLLQYGADPKLRDYQAFLNARSSGFTNIVDEIGHYIDPRTPIMYNTRVRLSDTVENIMEKGDRGNYRKDIYRY